MAVNPSSTLLERARQAEPAALAQALNYILRDYQLQARLAIAPPLVEVILPVAADTPAARVQDCIRGFFLHLRSPAIATVRIYAKHPGTTTLAWWHEFSLAVPIAPGFEASRSAPGANPAATPGWTPLTVAERAAAPAPLPFEQLPENLQERIRRAGCRSGETRSWHEAQQLYDLMPENIRRQGVAAVEQYKQTHDWSHKQAHSRGGSNAPSNGDWENSDLNRARGARTVSPQESAAIRQAKATINFQSGTRIVAEQAATAGAIGFGIELAFSGLDNFIAVQRGEKSVEQALGDTLSSSSQVAISTVVTVGGVVALTLVVPPVGTAIAASAPFLKVVGTVACVQRLVKILDRHDNVTGMEQLSAVMAAYGIDDVELDCRDLELDAELDALKAETGVV